MLRNDRTAAFEWNIAEVAFVADQSHPRPSEDNLISSKQSLKCNYESTVLPAWKKRKKTLR